MDSCREIENLINIYAELIDSGDLEGVARLFTHADFLDANGKIVAVGAQEFHTLQRRAVRIYADTGTPRTVHVTTNVIISVDEAAASATARSLFTVFQATEKLGLQPIIAGRYRDSFERIEGNWRFRQRQSIPELYGDLSKHLLFEVSDKMR